MYKKSNILFQQAQQVIPGGVNSPVRAFKAVDGNPLFIKRGEGPYLFDVDDNQYVDYVGSWGPLILGHANPVVVEAVCEAARQGLSFGAPTEREIELAELLCRLVPSIEQVRLVNSGTEATMSAIRLARGFTGRDKIIKFDGCYHGHADHLLVQAGSGALTFGSPSSKGVTQSQVSNTLVACFNDLDSVAALFEQYSDEIAAIIVEPIAGNMNCILPAEGFLEGLRALCNQYNTLLIFDEVMTGFRVALGGAQSLYNITPDLTTLGKVIGGGLPVGAFGGRRNIMALLAPAGPVYQAGTLSGNPMATAAGLATLKQLMQPGFYDALNKKTQTICAGLTARAQVANIPFTTQTAGSLFGFCFTNKRIETLADVKAADDELFKRYFHEMLKAGIYFAPSAYEASFISMAHNEAALNKTLRAAETVFASIKSGHEVTT